MNTDGQERSVIFGCVVDHSPRGLFQALRLVQSLRWFGGSAADATFGVYVEGDCDTAFRGELEHYGAVVWSGAPADADNPCRASLFLGRPEVAEHEVAVVLAPNALLCADPVALIDPQAVRARADDATVFSDEVFERAFASAGLEVPPKTCTTVVDEAPIIPFFDTAVVSVPTEMLPALLEKWVAHSQHVAADPKGLFKAADVTLLSPWLKTLRKPVTFEKFGLAMALADTGVPVKPLPVELNCPASYPSKLKLASIRPVICRYQPEPPDRANGSLVHYFMPHVAGQVTDALDAFNRRLAAELQDRPDALAGSAAGQISPEPWDQAAAEASTIRYKAHPQRKPPDLRIMIGASPRTGNNWLSHLLAEVYGLTRVFEIGGADRLPLVRPDVSFLLYQHVPPSQQVLDWGDSRNVTFVTVTRHPADVFLSFYHLVNDFSRTNLGGNFNKQPGVEKIVGQPLDSDRVYDFLANDFAQLYMSLYWVLSERAISVKYEDLNRETEKTLLALTEKIHPVAVTQVRAAIEECSKEKMRTKSEFMKLNVRKGNVGDGMRALNDRHFDVLRRRLADELPVLGYEI